MRIVRIKVTRTCLVHRHTQEIVVREQPGSRVGEERSNKGSCHELPLRSREDLNCNGSESSRSRLHKVGEWIGVQLQCAGLIVVLPEHHVKAIRKLLREREYLVLRKEHNTSLPEASVLIENLSGVIRVLTRAG